MIKIKKSLFQLTRMTDVRLMITCIGLMLLTSGLILSIPSGSFAKDGNYSDSAINTGNELYTTPAPQNADNLNQR